MPILKKCYGSLLFSLATFALAYLHIATVFTAIISFFASLIVLGKAVRALSENRKDRDSWIYFFLLLFLIAYLSYFNFCAVVIDFDYVK